MKKPKILPLILIGLLSIIIPISVYAHVGISDTPTTPCGTIDSTDLSTHIGNQIDDRISLSSSSTDLSLFTNRPTSTSTPWTRNPTVWTNQGTPVNFTGVAGWNTVSGSIAYDHGATLISPRHFIAANHYNVNTGSVVGFIDASGNHIERTVVDNINIAGTDISMGVLDSDVPDSITYYPIISSSTLASYFQKTQDVFEDMPIVTLDQEAKVLVSNMFNITNNSSMYHLKYGTLPRKEFGEILISGDSGQPAFMVIDNSPILLFTHYHSTDGPNIGAYIAEINAAMATTPGGYQVTEYTPDCFRAYEVNHYPVWPSGLPSGITIYESTTTLPLQLFDFTATDPDGDDINYRMSIPNEYVPGLGTTSNPAILEYISNVNFEEIQTQSEYEAEVQYALDDPDSIFADDTSVQSYIRQITQLMYKTAVIYATDVNEFPIEKAYARWVLLYNVEEPPVFDTQGYSFSVSENSPQGTSVGEILATDEDYDEVVEYSIESGNELGAFEISSSTGQLSVLSSTPLDYETRQTISLVVMASSTDNELIPNLFGAINYGTTTVTINILNVADTSSSGGGGSSSSSGGGGGGGGGASSAFAYVAVNSNATTTATSTTQLNLCLTGQKFNMQTGLPCTSTAQPEIVQCIAGYIFDPVTGRPCSSGISDNSRTLENNTVAEQNSYIFNKNLKLGMTDSDVRRMQVLLNSLGFSISASGAGSKGKETNFFGLRTRAALVDFQKAYAIIPASGFFGPITRTKIKGLSR